MATEIEKSLVKTLSTGPAVLLLGQSYLRSEDGVDPLLKELVRKYHPTATPSYDLFLKPLSANTTQEEFLGYLAQFNHRQTTPSWIKLILDFPWNHIYTSAIDTLWYRNLHNDWRNPESIFSDKRRPLNLRSQTQLQCTFLFGSLDNPADQEENRPPLSLREKLSRLGQVNTLLSRLPEIITPVGVLVVEGYDPEKDWLTPELLVPVLDQLHRQQVHVFSIAQESLSNAVLQEFVTEGKIVLHPETLASFLQRMSDAELLNLEKQPSEVSSDLRLEIGDRTVFIPADVWSDVSRSAFVLHNGLFQVPELRAADQRYYEFRRFLSESSFRPVWAGYVYGFNFRRDFEDNLSRRVESLIKQKDLIEHPVILHGQSGSGKTIALGAIGYHLLQLKKCAVLFIERKPQRPSLDDLERFCNWSEDKGSPSTVILWDGMVDVSQYAELLQILASRGKKVVLVGTSYLQPPDALPKKNKSYFIDAPATLSSEELTRFTGFIDQIDPQLSQYLLRLELDEYFLVALYRWLPYTRQNIAQNLLTEFSKASEIMVQNLGPSKLYHNSLAYALYSAGFITREDLNLEESTHVGSEKTTHIQKIIGLVMVPGKFGLSVPIEIIVRSLGKSWIDSLTQILSRQDIFRVQINEPQYDMYISPRHSLEARIFCERSLGTASNEIGYVIELLSQLSPGAQIDSSEIRFAVELLRKIGPNGEDPERYRPFFQQISEALENIRLNLGVENPRLMLQEAAFYREGVRLSDQSNDMLEALQDVIESLKRALEILRNDHTAWGGYHPLRHSIIVEIGANYRQQNKIITIDNAHIQRALSIYETARKHLLNAIGLRPEDFHPYDVLCWMGIELIKTGQLLAEQESEMKADMLSNFSLADPEEIDVSQRETYYKLQNELGRVVGSETMSQHAFDALLRLNPAAAYFLKATEISGRFSLRRVADIQPNKVAEALAYLENHYADIKKDFRCLYFYLKLWWFKKTGKPLLQDERQALPFSDADWADLEHLIQDMRQTDVGRSHMNVMFLQAVAAFHREQYVQSHALFKEIHHEAPDKRSKRRIIRSFLLSDSSGRPRQFTGTITRIDIQNDFGEVYISDLRYRVKFFPREFRTRSTLQVEDTLPTFYIAFNFLGPAADRIGYEQRQSKS